MNLLFVKSESTFSYFDPEGMGEGTLSANVDDAEVS
jgi:hypothetical protein